MHFEFLFYAVHGAIVRTYTASLTPLFLTRSFFKLVLQQYAVRWKVWSPNRLYLLYIARIVLSTIFSDTHSNRVHGKGEHIGTFEKAARHPSVVSEMRTRFCAVRFQLGVELRGRETRVISFINPRLFPLPSKQICSLILYVPRPSEGFLNVRKCTKIIRFFWINE